MWTLSSYPCSVPPGVQGIVSFPTLTLQRTAFSMEYSLFRIFLPSFLPFFLPTCTLNKCEASVFFAYLVQFFEQGNKIWKGLLGTLQSSNRIISKSAATTFLNSRILPNWGSQGRERRSHHCLCHHLCILN